MLDQYGQASLILFDGQGFKRFNKGLQAHGDIYLSEFAKVMEKAVSPVLSKSRGDKFLGRVGGDELMAVLRHVESDDLLSIAFRIMECVNGVSTMKVVVDGQEKEEPFNIYVACATSVPGDTATMLWIKISEALWYAKDVRTRIPDVFNDNIISVWREGVPLVLNVSATKAKAAG
jgi:diguanylate cyclase (GGDEF)-like protein